MASATPTIIGLVPELTAISSTTGPITATVALRSLDLSLELLLMLPGLQRKTFLNVNVVKILIKLSANHLAAPLDLNTAPNLSLLHKVQ